jgi:hypothetical protein
MVGECMKVPIPSLAIALSSHNIAKKFLQNTKSLRDELK